MTKEQIEKIIKHQENLGLRDKGLKVIIKRMGEKNKNNRYSKRSYWYVYPETFFELIYLLFREKKDKYLTKKYFEKNCWIVEYTYSHP